MSESVKALLEIDGPNVHPHTVDSRVAADLISTFFVLMGRAAVVRGVPLHVRGLAVTDKCFQLSCETAEPDHVREALEVFSSWVSGSERPDTKRDLELTRHFNSVVRSISEEATAKIAVGSWTRPLEFADRMPDLPPQVSTTLRVRVLDVGVRPARAKFESGSEDGSFSLAVTVEQAEALGRYINQELDLVFMHRRNRQGSIEDGQILQFFPMDEEDMGEGWVEWLTENGKSWRDLEDPVEELSDRGD